MVRMILVNPRAGGQGRLTGHVLTSRIAGGVVDAQEAQRADLVLADVRHLS